MLQKYLELLMSGLEAITGLSAHDATFLDYITAVGYEFAIILLGLFIITVSAVVLIGPFLLTSKINQRLASKLSETKNRLQEIINLTDKFRPVKMHYWSGSLIPLEEESYFNCEMAFNTITEMIKNGQSLKPYFCNEIYEVLKSINEKTTGFKCWYELDENVRCKVIEDFIKIYRFQEHTSAGRSAYVQWEHDKSKIEYKLNAAKAKNTRIMIAINIGVYLVWALFLIPLVLMFF